MAKRTSALVRKLNRRHHIAIALVLLAGSSVWFYSTDVQSSGIDYLPTGPGIHKKWIVKAPRIVGRWDYKAVDEDACNGTTDYVYWVGAGAPTERTSFKIDLKNIPAGATIKKITVKPCASNNFETSKNKPAAKVNPFIILGNETIDGASMTLQGTQPTELAGVAFENLNYEIPKDSAGIYIGLRYSSGKTGVRLSRLAAEISYVAVPPPYAQATYYAEASYAPVRSLDLKVDGSDGPLNLADEQPITVSWTSSGYTKCGLYAVWPELGVQYANIPDAGLSGTRRMYTYAPYYPVFIRLRCQTTENGVPVISDDTVEVRSGAPVQEN